MDNVAISITNNAILARESGEIGMSKVPVNGIPSFLPPSTNLKFYRHENWYIAPP